MGHPNPIVNPPLVWPLILGQTANDPSTNYFNIHHVLSASSVKGLRVVHKYSIRWPNLTQSSTQGTWTHWLMWLGMQWQLSHLVLLTWIGRKVPWQPHYKMLLKMNHPIWQCPHLVFGDVLETSGVIVMSTSTSSSNPNCNSILGLFSNILLPLATFWVLIFSNLFCLMNKCDSSIILHWSIGKSLKYTGLNKFFSAVASPLFKHYWETITPWL